MSEKAYTPEMQQYLESLPGVIQETIKQSNPNLSSLQELKQCAENLMKSE